MRALVLVVLTLAFTSLASAGLPSPCTLLTNAEVAKIFGSPVATRTPQSNGRFRMCAWTGAPLGNFTSAHASLTVEVSRTTRAAFDNAANQARGAVQVRGIGQAAYASNSTLRYLDVLQAGYNLFIVASYSADPLQTDKTVAKLLVTRL
jgi:hypothetical protein